MTHSVLHISRKSSCIYKYLFEGLPYALKTFFRMMYFCHLCYKYSIFSKIVRDILIKFDRIQFWKRRKMWIGKIRDNQIVSFISIVYELKSVPIQDMEPWIPKHISIILTDIDIFTADLYDFFIELAECYIIDIAILHELICEESISSSENKHIEGFLIFEYGHWIVYHGFIIDIFFFRWELQISGDRQTKIIIGFFNYNFLILTYIGSDHGYSVRI